MNELFNQDGCLTDYALSALIHDKPLDELERLELSEHLSVVAETVYYLIIPILGNGIHELSRSRIGVLILLNSRKKEVKIFGNHEKALRILNIFRMLLLDCIELIY